MQHSPKGILVTSCKTVCHLQKHQIELKHHFQVSNQQLCTHYCTKNALYTLFGSHTLIKNTKVDYSISRAYGSQSTTADATISS